MRFNKGFYTMPGANGFFILDAGPEYEIETQAKQRVQVMLVFEITPVDLGAVRMKPRPTTNSLGDPILPLAAQALLPTEAPDVIGLLDNGEATYELISFEWDSPIVIEDHITELTDFWHGIRDAGLHEVSIQQFSHVDDWVELTPNP